MIPEPRSNPAIAADLAWMYGCMAVYLGYQVARQGVFWLVWALDR